MENENKLEVLVERTKEFIQQRMRETGEMMPFAAVGIDRGEIMEIGLVPPPPNFNEEGRQRWFDLIRLCFSRTSGAHATGTLAAAAPRCRRDAKTVATCSTRQKHTAPRAPLRLRSTGLKSAILSHAAASPAW